jgi:hypothetical protein
MEFSFSHHALILYESILALMPSISCVLAGLEHSSQEAPSAFEAIYIRNPVHKFTTNVLYRMLPRLKWPVYLQRPDMDQRSSYGSHRPQSHTVSKSPSLCRRCACLQLLCHIEQPWAISQTMSTNGVEIALIDKFSLKKDLLPL